MRVRMHTDGGAAPNPGVGGWAAILEAPDYIGNAKYTNKGVFGYQEHGTNNEMEVVAILEGMREIKHPEEVDLEVCSDSVWAINALSGRFKKVKAHKDLVMQAHSLIKRFKSVTWTFVRGHNGIRFNEDCDSLVAQARREKCDRKAFYF